MRRFIVGLLATIGTVTLLAIGGCVVFLATGPLAPKPLPRTMVLSLDLRDVPPETAGERSAARRPVRRHARPRRYRAAPVAGGRRSARGRPVRRDRRRIGRPRPRPGAAPGDRALPRQGQVRGRLRRSAGQRRHHFADYYLASALDQIWLQPSGGFAVVGLAVETPFLEGRARQARRQGRGRQALGVQERARHLHRDRLSPPPARENLQQLIDGLYGQFVSDVARERKIAPAKLRQLIDAAPFDSERARRKGWSTARLSRRCDGRGRAARRHDARPGRRCRTMPTTTSGPRRAATSIALVRVTGTIMSGSPSGGLLDDDSIATAEDVVDALDQAAARQGGARRSCCASIRPAAPIPRPTPWPTPSAAPARPASR